MQIKQRVVRPRLSSKEWSTIVAQFRASGKAQATSCQDEGLSLTTLQKRLYLARLKSRSTFVDLTPVVPSIWLTSRAMLLASITRAVTAHECGHQFEVNRCDPGPPLRHETPHRNAWRGSPGGSCVDATPTSAKCVMISPVDPPQNADGIDRFCKEDLLLGDPLCLTPDEKKASAIRTKEDPQGNRGCSTCLPLYRRSVRLQPTSGNSGATTPLRVYPLTKLSTTGPYQAWISSPSASEALPNGQSIARASTYQNPDFSQARIELRYEDGISRLTCAFTGDPGGANCRRGSQASSRPDNSGAAAAVHGIFPRTLALDAGRIGKRPSGTGTGNCR